MSATCLSLFARVKLLYLEGKETRKINNFILRADKSCSSFMLTDQLSSTLHLSDIPFFHNHLECIILSWGVYQESLVSFLDMDLNLITRRISCCYLTRGMVNCMINQLEKKRHIVTLMFWCEVLSFSQVVYYFC